MMTKSNLIRLLITLIIMGIVMFLITNKGTSHQDAPLQSILEVEEKL